MIHETDIKKYTYMNPIHTLIYLQGGTYEKDKN